MKKPTGPRQFILTSELTDLELARRSGLSLNTLRKAKRYDMWPQQHRCRDALLAALGLCAAKVGLVDVKGSP
ncbi:MAG: hypothetical protein MUP86_02915 [Dehalococcoidia bacterium]|nr:hypothetical protein [Dehalococcoidia bacterium]